MTRSPDEQRSFAVAMLRRAAIAAMLWQGRGDGYVRGLEQLSRVALTDDACRLAARIDGLGVSDVALAQVVAEGQEALSSLARVFYGARLMMRAAGLAQQAPAGLLDARRRDSLTRGIRDEGPPRQTYAPDLNAAFVALRDAGVRRARAPRRLLQSLSIPDRTNGAVLRLLAAAYSDDRRALVHVACTAPFSIDVANLKMALAKVAGENSPRSALAGAVGELAGAAARESALAVIAALDAVRPVDGSSSVSLAAAAIAADEAIRSFALIRSQRFEDSSFLMLTEAAAQADRVWEQLDDAPMPLRVASLDEALSRAEVGGDLELVVDDGAWASCAGLGFADRASSPIAWEALSAALDIGVQPEASAALRVCVTVPLPRAVAAYLDRRLDLAQAALGADGVHVWPMHEPALVFTAPPMTFSASRLNAYVKCPRRWFYEYLCQVLEDPASLHAAYGRVVHDALEALHQKIRVPSQYQAPVMLDRLLRELDDAFGRSRDEFGSQLEYEVSRMRSRRMAEQYVRWLAAESARSPMEIVHVELLQRLRFGGHDFIGYIDRIDRPLGGGPVTIFDYKTGRIDADAGQYLAKVRRGDEAQLALYYAMRSASGDHIGRIALVSVRDPRDDVWILALDITADDGTPVIEREPHDGVLRARCSRADLETSLQALVARCDMLTLQGVPHFSVGDDPPCGFCAYARACRERPADGERIFAR